MKVQSEWKETFGDTEFTVTFTDLAKHATSSVLVEAGGTLVLVSVVMANEEHNLNYFPLSVDFEERFYSVNAILGGRYMRREGRPSQEAVLNGRIIDRTIRPLFPKGFRRSTQVIVTTLAFGKQNPVILGILGTSIALATSSIPWQGPVSPVVLSKIDGSWCAFSDNGASQETLLLCGKDDVATMIEVGAHQVTEQEIGEAFQTALHEMQKVEAFQKKIVQSVAVDKAVVQAPSASAPLQQHFSEAIEPHIHDAVFGESGAVTDIERQWHDTITSLAEGKDDQTAAKRLFSDAVGKIMRDSIFDTATRVDGRALDEVRPLFAQAGGLSPLLHGSGLFYRGDTHVFTALTLGGPEDSLLMETVEKRKHEERFMHHYNFPPFSAGAEVRRVGPPNRREIGHGALAEKALRPVLPNETSFPYTIRLVSECFSSNGSTSMGSVCASTLALMDGGVPITAPVAGIAIGVVRRGDEYRLLTDIQGPEDHHGDMDFKVAGTEQGITAIQMDVKIDGVPLKVLLEALERARDARLHILKTITDAITTPRTKIADSAPTIKKIQISPDTIGLVIGSGGKTIRALKEKYAVKEITIEDDGTVTVSGATDSVEQASVAILSLTKKVEVGDLFDGEVVNIVAFGAFVKLSEKTEALLHISEFAPQRVESADTLVSVGDIIPVVVKEIDRQGKIKVSVKERDASFFKDKL